MGHPLHNLRAEPSVDEKSRAAYNASACSNRSAAALQGLLLFTAELRQNYGRTAARAIQA
ncbi:MAG: hypothetical protein LDL24_05200 [Treponema sp.]|nr:hypothetical protein [Treponema sp.]